MTRGSIYELVRMPLVSLDIDELVRMALVSMDTTQAEHMRVLSQLELHKRWVLPMFTHGESTVSPLRDTALTRT